MKMQTFPRSMWEKIVLLVPFSAEQTWQAVFKQRLGGTQRGAYAGYGVLTAPVGFVMIWDWQSHDTMSRSFKRCTLPEGPFGKSSRK